ncbi:two-component regulator propeller domain-containing protein [Spirosoma daeguense]
MIFGMVQDQKGFIWVATKDGLNRYDGQNFTVFTHDPYDPYSLSDNNCSALLLDRHKRLWVGTLNEGLNVFNPETQRFYHIDILDKTASNAENYTVDGLFEDPQGNIWVAANANKLIKINLPASFDFPENAHLSPKIQMVQLPVSLPSTNPIKQLSFRADGQALVICESGTYAFNWQFPQKKGQFTPFSSELANLYSIYSNLSEDSHIASFGDKVLFRLRDQQKRIRLPKGNEAILVVKALDKKTLALATDKFLWLMSPEELLRQDSLTAKNAFVALPPHLYAVTDILRDQTGNIWIGTSGYGIRKFNPRIKQFQSFLPNTTLSYIYTDRQGRTYLRHEFAYDELDRAGNRMKPFLGNNLVAADKRARYMMQDRQGTFWISNTNFQTQAMSLFKFSSDWKLLKKYPLPPNTSYGFYQNYTVEDQAGRLWLGVINGKLLRFDPKSETFKVFSYQSLLPQKGSEIETSSLYFDQNGTLWIGTTRGLIRATNLETVPIFSVFRNSIPNRQSLSNDVVSSLLNDPDQPKRYLWVGTKGGGLNRLDKQTGLFDHISEAQGLPNKVVYGILADQFKNLWLSTNRGIAQFNPRNRTFRNFTKADGLQDDEFNTSSFFKSPSGELLFGGVHGLTAFRADNVIQSTAKAPQAQLVALKINNEVVRVGEADGILARGIEYTQRIDLAHTQNLLTLEFSVMDFANSAKNRYRYRLLGIDTDWIEAGTNRFANYAQLPDGNYTFQMMGSTDGHQWSKPVTLQVRVHPPFYRTWWAYALYVVLLAAIGWQLYRFQTERLLLEQRIVFEHKEASRLAELDLLRTKFFTNISHEFRTPLTLILTPLSDLKERFPTEPVLAMMERNGKRLLSLINQLLDLSKLEAGQLKPETESGDIAVFFQTLAGSFSSLAQSRQITFTFEQSKPRYVVYFDRDKLEKIVTNLLSNAFKFTPVNHEVRMTVRYPASDMLVFTVLDSGIGIPASHLARIFERFYQVDDKRQRTHEGTGIGLTLVNELVQVLGGTIDVSSIEDVGTTFMVTLPIHPLEQSTSDRIDANDSYSELSVISVTSEGSSPVSLTETVLEETDKLLLIVDDNPDIRTYIRSIFEDDFQILEAEDGQHGLELATATLPTLVICDLMMPRLDGFGFCRELKTQSVTSHIPVIMLTAKATVEDRIEGFELGADDYQIKPFNRPELRARVRNLIEQRQRLYQWFNLSRVTSEVAPAQQLIPPLTLLTSEQLFLDQLTNVVQQNLSDVTFSVEQLADAVSLSRSQLHRKLKVLTNTSPTQFIRDIRLAKASELLTEGEQSVTQIAYAVGFDNLSYFSKTFQDHYGVSPSQYGRLPATPS